jgi:hypothetical protein
MGTEIQEKYFTMNEPFGSSKPHRLMDPSKLNRLSQIEIANPCSEDWDKMNGDDQQRFCAGCGCFVHNVSAMAANDAEKLLSKSEKVCTRLLVDERKGVLTRDGWIPRLMLAGAISISAAGCAVNPEAAGPTLAPYSGGSEQGEVLGKVAVPQKQEPPKPEPKFLLGDVAVQQKPKPLMGKPAPPKELTGTPAPPQHLTGWPKMIAEKPTKFNKPSKPPKKISLKKTTRKKR